MASVTSRQGLIDYCLRKLGQPVIEINVDEDQLDEGGLDYVSDLDVNLFHELDWRNLTSCYREKVRLSKL